MSCYRRPIPTDNIAPSYAAGPAVQITLDLPADVARALAVYIARQPGQPLSHEDAAVDALREFLTAMGCLPFAEMPEGREEWH